jgi:hypothetical protein
VALKHSTKEKSAANHGATTSSNNNNGGTTTLVIERREPENGLAVVSLGNPLEEHRTAHFDLVFKLVRVRFCLKN